MHPELCPVHRGFIAMSGRPSRPAQISAESVQPALNPFRESVPATGLPALTHSPRPNFRSCPAVKLFAWIEAISFSRSSAFLSPLVACEQPHESPKWLRRRVPGHMPGTMTCRRQAFNERLGDYALIVICGSSLAVLRNENTTGDSWLNHARISRFVVRSSLSLRASRHHALCLVQPLLVLRLDLDLARFNCSFGCALRLFGFPPQGLHLGFGLVPDLL